MQGLLELLKQKEKMVLTFKRKILGYQNKVAEVNTLQKRIDQHEEMVNDVFDLNRQSGNDLELLDGIEE